MNVYVGIATSGRNQILAHAIDSARTQECPPDLIVVCAPYGEDPHLHVGAEGDAARVVVLHAQKGSCSQRNAILDHLDGKPGLLLIIDDDFILHKSYLRLLRRFMASNPDVAILNGTLVADGISGPGLSVADAKRMLARVAEPESWNPTVEDCVSIYGCNMAINLEKATTTRFDENLPLYGWQEDVDFSARLKRCGRVVKANLIAGVHLGVKSGRAAGVNFGFSQIVNPAYLVRKGTMNLGHALGLICRNVVMNIVRWLRPEPYIDRRGRLKGNLMGVACIIRGQCDPRQVTKIQ